MNCFLTLDLRFLKKVFWFFFLFCFVYVDNISNFTTIIKINEEKITSNKAIILIDLFIF